MSSGRRLQNLGELLSPTVQGTGRRRGGGGAGGCGGGGGGAGGGGCGGRRRRPPAPLLMQGAQPGPRPGPGDSGSLHCTQNSTKRGCDTCEHMVETTTVFSHWRKKHFGIHGRNVHCKATEKSPLQWFVYCVECLPCQAQYVGSTTNVASRWKNHKYTANTRKASCSGISKHFSEGCPNDQYDQKKMQLRITLIDSIHTTPEKLTEAGHIAGPQCRCTECSRLKSVEDDWICKLGTFYGKHLNSRNEIKSKSRVNSQW